MKRGNIWIYDEIAPWGVTAQSFTERLEQLKSDGHTEFNIYINSPGGDVFQAISIYNEIKSLDDVRIVISGLAASAASLIAMASDDVRMTNNSRMMIHNPWNWGAGDADYFLKLKEQLDDVKDIIVAAYVAKTGGQADEISGWMDNEEWLTPETALERGFVDRVVNPEETRNFVTRILNAFRPEKTNGNNNNNNNREGEMNPTLKVFIGGLTALFGMDNPGEDLDKILAAITQAHNAAEGENQTLQERIESLETERETLWEQVSEYKAAEAAAREAEINNLLNDAQTAGRILPAERPVYAAQLQADYDGTRTILEALAPHGLAVTVKPPDDQTTKNSSTRQRMQAAIKKSNQASTGA